MTSTIERPAAIAAEVAPIVTHPTRRVAVALAAVEELLGRVDYASLPEIHGVQVAAWHRGTEVIAQLASGDDKAGDVLAWRNAIPGGYVSMTRQEHSGGYWSAQAHLPIAGGTVAVWTHLRGLTDEQAERLERDPQTAYAVLAELARAAT